MYCASTYAQNFTFWASFNLFVRPMFLCDLVEHLADHGLLGGRTGLDSFVFEFVAVRETKSPDYV